MNQLIFLQQKKKRRGNRSNPAWGRMQELCLARSDQSSAFLRLSFGAWGASPWQQTAGRQRTTFITCIQQRGRSAEARTTRGSCPCPRRRKTWRRRREILLYLSFSIFFSSCLWLQLRISKTCNTF